MSHPYDVFRNLSQAVSQVETMCYDRTKSIPVDPAQ